MNLPPKAKLTVVTLGVADVRRSIVFYSALGFRKKFSNDSVAFFETGASALALFSRDSLADDTTLPRDPRPEAFRGSTLAWNCNSVGEVDVALAFAISQGARLLKATNETFYGGYSGYFSDPDGHPWEIVTAPGIEVLDDGRVQLPE